MAHPTEGENVSPATSIEVYRGIIYSQESDEILMVRRAQGDSYMAGHYEFPGGKIDPGEDAVAVLLREVEEETGLIVTPMADSVEKATVYVDRTPIESGKYEGMLHVSRFILSRVVSGSIKLSDEHDAFAWERVHEAARREPIAPASLEALKRFQFLWALANTR
jgi:8-oxo-dGTP diphosphatase